MAPPAALPKLDRARSVLVVVDVQERLHAAMSGREALTLNVSRLVRAAGLLGVPVVATEQYPKGLGRTIPAVAESLPGGATRIEKTCFSAVEEPAFARAFDALARDQVVLCGIESHVCVLQTGLDLLARGVAVHVTEDATASRSPENRAAGARRLAEAGAVPSTTETAIFEWLRSADDPQFRAVQALLK